MAAIGDHDRHSRAVSLFLPLVLPSLGVFSLAGSFRCLFLLFVLSARFMLLGSLFTWVYFLLEPFFFQALLSRPAHCYTSRAVIAQLTSCTLSYDRERGPSLVRSRFFPISDQFLPPPSSSPRSDGTTPTKAARSSSAPHGSYWNRHAPLNHERCWASDGDSPLGEVWAQNQIPASG
jgi:hypothetical protein